MSLYEKYVDKDISRFQCVCTAQEFPYAYKTLMERFDEKQVTIRCSDKEIAFLKDDICVGYAGKQTYGNEYTALVRK